MPVPESEQSHLIVTIMDPKTPKYSFNDMHDFSREHGFTIYPGKLERQGTFRLCALGAIDAPDIEEFWKVFEEALRVNGIHIPVKY